MRMPHIWSSSSLLSFRTHTYIQPGFCRDLLLFLTANPPEKVQLALPAKELHTYVHHRVHTTPEFQVIFITNKIEIYFNLKFCFHFKLFMHSIKMSLVKS